MEIKISPRVQKILNIIATGDKTPKELASLLNNVLDRLDQIPEEERELVIEAISQEIKSSDPRLAKKMFGPKDAFARDYLQRLYDTLVDAGYDFSKNRVKAGVKTGGDMIAGKAYVDLYFSYKNKDKWHAGIAFRHETVDQSPKLIVAIYQGGESNPVGKERTEFDASDEEKALDLYRGYLDRIIN